MVESNAVTSYIIGSSKEASESSMPPQLAVVGFTTLKAIELYQESRPARNYHIMHRYLTTHDDKNELVVNRRLSATIGTLYCDRAKCGESPFDTISMEVKQICDREPIKAITIATPCFDDVLERVGEYAQCKTISLSLALAKECWKITASGRKKVGIFGSICDLDEKSVICSELSRAGINYIRLSSNLSRYVTFCIEHEMHAGITYEDKFYDDGESFCLHLLDKLSKGEHLDGIIVCNPELHGVTMKFRQKYPDLPVIDAAEAHWKIINGYLLGSESSPA